MRREGGEYMLMTMTMTMTKEVNIFGFRFRDWDIYKDAREFRKEINRLIAIFPKEERFALVD